MTWSPSPNAPSPCCPLLSQPRTSCSESKALWTDRGIRQRSATHSLWATCGRLPAFVNKVLLNNHYHVMSVFALQLQAEAATGLAHKAQDTHILGFKGRSFWFLTCGDPRCLQRTGQVIQGQETKGRDRAGMKGGAGCGKQGQVNALALWECCQAFPVFVR